jgi:hypothetical protein
VIDGGDVLIGLDVQRAHLQTALVVFSDLAHDGVEEPTGTTVGGVEVYQCRQGGKDHRFGKALVGETDRRIAALDPEGKRRLAFATPGLGGDPVEAKPVLALTLATGKDDGARAHGRGGGE